MNAKTLAQLDYVRIREQAAFFCLSEEGKKAFSERQPLTDNTQAEALKKRSRDWTMLIDAGVSPPLNGWQPVEHIFPVLSAANAVLPLEHIYALGIFCRSAVHVKKYFDPIACPANFPQDIRSLPETALGLPDLQEAEKLIFRIIDSSGKLKNLKELQAIRLSIQNIRHSIEYLIKAYTTDSRFQQLLQSSVPVLRNGRQVLAVKAAHKTKIKGIVHEVSQTGQTVYIEPADIVQKNNELVEEEFRMQKEIRRILTVLTAQLTPFAADFEKALRLMVELDTSRAAALWGIEHHCNFAETADDDHPLLLLQARHPLLGDKAVPIDIEFRKGSRILIITGANTGGKTVTVKTLALFALLNQSGFPLPAEQGSRLPFFTSFFADIGDEQNIDESLSTFSAHMKNIGEMLEQADENSLIVLDELGSGTDPQEGAAIAMAVLDELIRKKSFVLVTTHHGSLKNYGCTHGECLNASVEFAENTLHPTYRIRMGIPGESRALSIAEKSGIKRDIIERAKKYVENRQTDISFLIENLNKKYIELEALQNECRVNERALNEKRYKLELKDNELKQKEIQLRESALKKDTDFLIENRKMLENLVRELREGEITRKKTLKVKSFIGALEQRIADEKNSLETEHSVLKAVQEDRKHTRMTYTKNEQDMQTEQGKSVQGKFYIGMEVFAGRLKTRGTITAKGKKGMWLVQTPSIKISCLEDDLLPAPPKSYSQTASFSVELAGTDKDAVQSDTPVLELKLLGIRLEEALKTLKRQLDLCTVQGLHEFSVIHGKGNGILQEGVHGLLSSSPCVQSFCFALPEDGGTGKTYVKLKT